MRRSTAIRSTPAGVLHRVVAAVAVWAALAQIALPALHTWVVDATAQRSRAFVSTDGAATWRLAPMGTPRHSHDASDCPVCRGLLQVRHFVAPVPATSIATVWLPSIQPQRTFWLSSTDGAPHASPRAPPVSA